MFSHYNPAALLAKLQALLVEKNEDGSDKYDAAAKAILQERITALENLPSA